jgi:hypothetical protein
MRHKKSTKPRNYTRAPTAKHALYGVRALTGRHSSAPAPLAASALVTELLARRVQLSKPKPKK